MSGSLRTLLVSLLVGLLSYAAVAGELRIKPSYRQLDRIYFPIGEEAHVYQYSSFTIYFEGDSIYAGRIAHAWQGVSVSEVIDSLPEDLQLDSVEAVIQTAWVDSLSQIAIGTDLADLNLFADPDSNSRLALHVYDDRTNLVDDFQLGLLDGIVMFDNLHPRQEGVITIAEAAPYMAVLVPNAGRKENFQGQLTTSLYYRFNSDRLAVSFDGDQAQLVNRLTPKALYRNPTRRRFEYNPERGRQLLNSLTYQPSLIRLYSGNKTLDGLAFYFADIISRDRIRVEIVTDRRTADVRLELVPSSISTPSATIYWLYHQLVTDSVAGLAANEHIRRLAAEFSFVESPRHPGDYYRHLHIAGRIMSEELGIFPLFQPTFFVHTHKRLQGVTVDDDGRCDFSRAVLIDLPEPDEAIGR